MTDDAVALTQTLIGFDSRNPPGAEAACAAHLAELLEAAGFAVELHELAPGRPNLVARLGAADAPAPPLAFTGHLDTVPLGTRTWSRDPFGGEIAEGRLYGRGASDMKSGIAAFVVAALAEAERLRAGPGALLILTAGEETGCDGAKALAAAGKLGRAGALVVAEPTSNRPLVGHKGALWLKATTSGKSAHGSMPHEGINAIYKAARLVAALEDFDFNVARHPGLGAPTLNVGTLEAGQNVNSVPDRAEIGIDLRTLPGMGNDRLRAQMCSYLGAEAEVETLVDLAPVWSEAASSPWLRHARACAAAIAGQPSDDAGANYFSDASVLTPALGGVPTLVCGPGEAPMAHQTDEYCCVARIPEAVEIYRALLADWQNAA